MSTILNRIFYIPEIEELIFEYLDPVLNLKNIAAISHHYHNLIEYNEEYTEIRNFCKSQKECNLTTFVNACKQGNICAVKYIYTKKNISHEELTKALRFSCYNNRLEITTWLYNLPERLKPSLGSSRMGLPERLKPSLGSSRMGLPERLKPSLGSSRMVLPERLKPSLGSSRMGLPKQFCPSLDLTDLWDRCLDNEYVFVICCQNGHLEMIMWLYNLSGFFDMDINYDLSFAKSCRHGHLEVAQWLYNLLNSIDIHANNNSIFKLSCQNNHLKVALWLITICDKYQLTINDNKIISHVP